MRRICTWILMTFLCVSLLAGCDVGKLPFGLPTDPPQTKPTQPQATPEATQPGAQLQETVAEEGISVDEDSYWVACHWQSNDDDGEEGAQALPSEFWYLDLILRADGTARFRDIHEGVCLMDDSCLNLVWEAADDGQLLFYSELYAAPILRGYASEGDLLLEYWGSTLTMRKETMPETAGQMYSPAELAGTWLLASSETEGWQWEAMPNELSSIVFEVTSYEGPLILSADMEARDYYGNMINAVYGQKVEVLEEPLYWDCENEAWSVRIGEVSPLDENGYPTDTEIYATMISDDLLLLQRYYTLDGYPAVSYQTYMRMADIDSWMDYQSMDLAYTNWVCTGFESAMGEAFPIPPEMEGLTVVLGDEGECLVSCGGADLQGGTWILENGGVLLLRSESAPYWFGGIVSGYWVETTQGQVERYQMALYYNGGILKLALDSYG